MAVDGTHVTLSIDARAARWGERLAIVDIAETDRFAPAGTIDEDRLTYGGLAKLSAWLASALESRGVGPGETVVLVSRNRIVALAMVFACHRLGATFAPVSHRLTPVTVGTPLSIVDPALVIAESAQRDLVRGIDDATTVTLAALFDAADVADPARTAGVESAATSAHEETAPLLALHGSDGTPVVTFDAAAVEANCLSATLTWGLGPTDRTVLLRPLSRPDGLLGVALPALYAGGRLAIDRAFDPADAATAVRALGTTYLAGKATEFSALLEGDRGAESIEAVDWVSVSGWADANLVAKLAARGPTVRRSFGWLDCPNALASSPGSVPREGDRAEPAESQLVGRPFLDVDARLVADGTVVSNAGEGELTVSGPTVASAVRTDATGQSEPLGVEDRDSRRDGARNQTWRRTGTRFRRDEQGRYYLQETT